MGSRESENRLSSRRAPAGEIRQDQLQAKKERKKEREREEGAETVALNEEGGSSTGTLLARQW